MNWVAPGLGLKRLRARALQDVLLSYEGVRSARRIGGWTTTGASGNSEIDTGIRKLRENARDLCRNNAYARKAKREWAKRVVGTGIMPRPNTGSDRTDNRLTDLWGQFAENCCSDKRINFYAAEEMIVSSCYETGEVLIRLWDRFATDGLPVPMQIQILEADFLDLDKTQSTDTGYIIHGVQFDRLGRIRGYWIHGDHPGEISPRKFRSTFSSKFIPAEAILHHAELDRPGDVRAVSRLSAVMAKLRDLDEYADAEIVRKKVSTCLTGMITQPEGANGPTVGTVAVDADGKKVEEFRPGQLLYGEPGVDLKFFAPPDAGDYASYKEAELREVAVGSGIPYILLDDNWRATNYSSGRMSGITFKEEIERYRWNWLIPQVLDPIWKRFVDKAWLIGAVPELNYSVEWDPPQFELLDRAIEAEADRIELQIGSSSWPQVISRRGYDPKTQAEEIGKWKPILDAAGVTFAKSTTDSGEQGGQNANSNNQS